MVYTICQKNLGYSRATLSNPTNKFQQEHIDVIIEIIYHTEATLTVNGNFLLFLVIARHLMEIEVG